MANKTVLVNVRFSPEELRPLQALATQHDRPLSYMVRTLALAGLSGTPVAAQPISSTIATQTPRGG